MYERESGRHWVKGVEVDADLDLAEEECVHYTTYGMTSYGVCDQLCGALHPHVVATIKQVAEMT